MYKVFINEKTILIAENINSIEKGENFKIHNYINNNELKTTIESFASDENLSILLILHTNTIHVLKQLFKIFRLIKASGGIVRNNKNEILFIFRRGKWDLPKGKKNLLESNKHAALREVSEECGISGMKILRTLAPTYHIYILKNNWIIKKTCWYEMLYTSGQKPIPQTEEDITAIQWFDHNNLNTPLQNTFKSIQELLSGI